MGMPNRTGYEAPVMTNPTTDATTTTLASYPLDEGQTIALSALVSGVLSGGGGASSRPIYLAFARRPTAGNITLVDSVQYGTLVEDSTGSATAITVDVDTTTQTMRIRVTGIAAETWYWKALVWVLYS